MPIALSRVGRLAPAWMRVAAGAACRRSFRIALAVAVAAVGSGVAGAGCRGDAKSVTIVTDPAGATVQLVRMDGRGGGGPEPVKLSRHTSPVTANLSFAEGQTYRATATRPQFLPGSAEIALAPKNKTEYRIPLTRYLADVDQFVFVPRFADQVWAWEIRPEPTTAYVLGVGEGDPPEATPGPSLQRMTDNTDPAVDFHAIATSPTSDDIAYERVERRAMAPAFRTVPRDSEASAVEIAAANGVTLDSFLASNPALVAAGGERARPAGMTLRIDRQAFVSEIYVRSPQRASAARLTSDRAMERTPAFDRRGENVVFSSDGSSLNSTLWRVRREGGGTKRTRLTASGANDFEPSVGREFIAYTSIPARFQSSEPEVWTMRVGGGEQSKLADGESPQVSPDESRIVYVSRYHDPSTKRLVRRLWVMRLDGSDAGALTANTDYDTIEPRWSPDGRWIVFAANPADGAGKIANYDLFLIPAEGTPTPLRLTRNEAYDSSPVFDRTGRFLYFRSNRGGHWNIWRLALALPANGSAPVR